MQSVGDQFYAEIQLRPIVESAGCADPQITWAGQVTGRGLAKREFEQKLKEQVGGSPKCQIPIEFLVKLIVNNRNEVKLE